jgi:hypothetical protein
MTIHLPTATKWLVFGIRICVQLCKELLGGSQTGSEHKSLIAVIPASEIPILEKFRHCHLCNLFAVAKNAKLSLAGQNLLAGQQARLPAYTGKTVISKDFFPEFFKGKFRIGMHG